jgi:hypothetical protein
MTKLIASLFGLAIIVAALPAAADCAGHNQTTVQSTPVVTSDANGTTAPTTPAPPPTTTAAPKTGG